VVSKDAETAEVSGGIPMWALPPAVFFSPPHQKKGLKHGNGTCIPIGGMNKKMGQRPMAIHFSAILTHVFETKPKPLLVENLVKCAPHPGVS